MVTTTDTTPPSSERIGVTLMSVRTLRPSGTDSSTSSARIVVALPSCRARGNSSRETSRPSECRHVITSSSCSGGRPGVRSPSTMRRASRLNETGWPVPASKHRHADRRGLDERLEVGPRPLEIAVRARVRDRRRRLRREKHQDLLVLARERLAVLLVAEKEVAEMLAPVVHRGPMQRPRGPGRRREAERVEVAGQIRHPERLRLVAKVFEESPPVGPLHHLPVLFGRKAGCDEVLDLSLLIDRRDHAQASAGERAGTLDDLLQHGGQVQALADAQDGRAQPRDAVVGGPRRVSIVQYSTPAEG